VCPNLFTALPNVIVYLNYIFFSDII
jgi:hypothetical protein